MTLAEPIAPGRSLWRGARPQTVFAIIALLFGSALALLTPPFQVPDEAAHFLRVYQLSQGQLFATRFGEAGYGGTLPSSLGRYFNDFEFLKFHPLNKTTFTAVANERAHPIQPGKTQLMNFPNTALYSPMPYLPQILGTIVAKSLFRSPAALLYAGRLASVLGYAIIGYLAVAATPVLKWPSALVLAAPMSLFLAASESADQLTIAFAFLAVALVLRIALGPAPASRATILALAAAMLAMSLCKSAYVPLVALLAAIPTRQWARRNDGTNKDWWIAPATIAALCLIAVVTWSKLTDPTNVRERPGVMADPKVQIHWIEHNPRAYADVLLTTTRVRGWNIFFSGIGVLGWVDTTLSTYGLEIYVLAACWLVLAYDSPLFVPPRLRIAAAITILASMVLVATGIYIIWDPAGTPMVDGMQGRYLLPLALPFFAIFQRRGRYPVIAGWVALLMVVTSTYTLFAVLQRYYLPG